MKLRGAWFFLGLLIAFAESGCASRRAGGGAILSASLAAEPSPVLGLMSAVSELGFKCEQSTSGTAAVCKHDRWSNQIIEIKSDPPRLVHTSAYGFKKGGGCAEAGQQVTSLSSQYNIGSVWCWDDSLVVQGALLLPHGGFRREELAVYFKWWGEAIAAMLAQSNLLALMK